MSEREEGAAGGEDLEARVFPTDMTCLMRAGGWLAFHAAYEEWKGAGGDDD